MGRHRNFAGSSPLPHPPEDEMFTAKLHLSATQIKALAATPITVIGAPGPSKTLVPFGWAITLNFLTTAFTAGSNLIATIGDPVNLETILQAHQSFVQTGSSAQYIGNEHSPWSVDDTVALMQNQPLKVTVDGAEFTAGLGSMDITVFYAVQS